MWPLALIGTPSGIGLIVSLSNLAFQVGKGLYSFNLFLFAVQLIWSNYAGYAGRYAWLQFSIYFLIAVFDFVISLIYSKEASDWYAIKFEEDTINPAAVASDSATESPP